MSQVAATNIKITVFGVSEKKTPFRVGPLEKAFFGQTSKKIVVKADPGIYIYNHIIPYTTP